MPDHHSGRVNAHGGRGFGRFAGMQTGQKTGGKLVARAGEIDNFFCRQSLRRYVKARLAVKHISPIGPISDGGQALMTAQTGTDAGRLVGAQKRGYFALIGQ